MNKNLQITLARIGTLLNRANVLWGVGASVLLHQYQLVDHPSDIDILVASQDIPIVDKLLSSIGTKNTTEASNLYATEHFHKYTIEGIDIDLMAGFNIITDQGIYKFNFSSESIPHKFSINGETIPFMSIEDWYIIYQLIPNRQHKVNLIENLFREKGIQFPNILHNQLENKTLPLPVKSKIIDLLNEGY